MMRSSIRCVAASSSLARPIVARSVIRPIVGASRSVLPAGGRVEKRGYHEKVIDHYENPRNVRFACASGTGCNRKDLRIDAGSSWGSYQEVHADGDRSVICLRGTLTWGRVSLEHLLVESELIIIHRDIRPEQPFPRSKPADVQCDEVAN